VDLGTAGLLAEAIRWQSFRSLWRQNELALAMEDPDRSGWVPEIHGLFGVAGELILVCTEAAVDEMLAEWDAADADPRRPEFQAVRAAAWRSMRFFLEAQGNNLVVFGHTIANLTVRTLSLYEGFDAALVGRKPNFRKAFEQRATDQDAWLSFNQKTIGQLCTAAGPLGPWAVALCEWLQVLRSGEMGALFDLRGGQYHRWRGESPGLPGVDFHGPRMVDRLVAGEVVGITPTRDPYVEGRESLEDLHATVTSALRQVAGWMPVFLGLWTQAFEEVRRGTPTSAVVTTSAAL
jgi:hypothetical protein